jgi:hypothetical protein
MNDIEKIDNELKYYAKLFDFQKPKEYSIEDIIYNTELKHRKKEIIDSEKEWEVMPEPKNYYKKISIYNCESYITQIVNGILDYFYPKQNDTFII